MIDVTIQPIGRTLLAMSLSAIKYKAVMVQKEYQLFKTEVANLARLEEESSFMSDLTFDLTSSMIDKRFTTSKQYVQTRGVKSDFQFKKSTSKSDRELVQLAKQNAIKTRVKYSRAVSSHNKRVMDYKMKSSLRYVDMKKYI